MIVLKDSAGFSEACNGRVDQSSDAFNGEIPLVVVVVVGEIQSEQGDLSLSSYFFLFADILYPSRYPTCSPIKVRLFE